MNELTFWRSWNKGYKQAFIFLAILSVICICMAIFGQLKGKDLFFPLQEVRSTESIELDLHQVEDPVFEIPVVTRAYIVWQEYLALELNDMGHVMIALLLITAICIAFISAALTYLSKLWFAIGQSFVIIWLVTLKLPYLNVFGVGDSYLQILFIILFLGLGYLFRSVFPDKGLLIKFLSFLGLCSFLISSIYFGSEKEAPLLFSAYHAIIVPILISLLFIGNIAYDILLHILRILSNKNQPEGAGNFKHFLLFSLLYLSYVTLTFLRNNNSISWDIVYLDEFLLLIISSILGIWAFKKRSALLGTQLKFSPLGAYLYLIGAVLTFTTIAWVFLSANDPLIDVFEDAIIFSHLAFGITFFVYVVINFYEFLRKGYGIYPVLYDPKRVPAGMIRAAGIAIIALLLVRTNYIPYLQFWSGYYNNVSDYYQAIDNDEAAYTSRQIARQYTVSGHKSNYSLGLHFYNKKEWPKSAYYFAKANTRRPSVQAYLSRAQAQLNNNQVFESLFTLKDAAIKFPDNSYVLNMKGIVFEKLQNVDSAFIYFDAAKRSSNYNSQRNLTQANLYGLFAKNRVNEDVNKLEDDELKTVPLTANWIALANSQQKYKADRVQFILPKDSSLTYNDFSFLFNYVTNLSLNNQEHLIEIDSIKGLLSNKPFKKSLSYAQAVNLNYAGKQKQAYSLIYELENAEITDAGYYHLLHGLWLLDQEVYDLAQEQFDKAKKLKTPSAASLKIISLLYQKNLYQANSLFLELDSAKTVSTTMFDVDQLRLFFKGKVELLNPSFKYLWLVTNPSLSLPEKLGLIQDLKGSYYANKLVIEDAKELISIGEYSEAHKLLGSLINEKLTLQLQKEFDQQYLICQLNLKNKNKWPEIDESHYSIYPKNYKLLAKAVNAHKNSLSSTDSLMFDLANENAFFEEGILLAINYYNQKQQYERAYQALVEASRLNPGSIKLLKAYALQSLRVNIRSYARSALEELALILSEEEYSLFEKKFINLEKELDENQVW